MKATSSWQPVKSPKARKELNPFNGHVILEADPSPVETQMRP